jgi:hypothetical protein
VRRLICDTESGLYISLGEDFNVIIYGDDVKYCQILMKKTVTSIAVLGDSKCLCCSEDGTLIKLDMTNGNILSESKFL